MSRHIIDKNPGKAANRMPNYTRIDLAAKPKDATESLQRRQPATYPSSTRVAKFTHIARDAKA